MRKKTLDDLSREELNGKRALVRVDYNVPLEQGGVKDATRVEASLPTLRALLEAGARPVLVSHLGRPKGSPDPAYSLAPVAPVLGELLDVPVHFFEETDTEAAVHASRDLASGEVLLLENTRFLPGETRNDEDLAGRLARLGDLFVNDAFGSAHRAHASTVGVAKILHPAVAGRLLEVELDALSRLRTAEERPFVVVFGGAKISDKIDLLSAFLERADVVLVGGAMANTFLRAQGGSTGCSLVEEDALDEASSLLEAGGERIRLPVDVVVAELEASDASDARVVPAHDVPDGLAALDIGPETRETFGRTIRESRIFFWNGPMGLFERSGFETGTVAVGRAAAEATAEGAFTVIGGGDSARAIREAELEDRVSRVSTGGGAALEFLATGTLPGLEALDEAP
jgi:phosphoglycerate kinase